MRLGEKPEGQLVGNYLCLIQHFSLFIIVMIMLIIVVVMTKVINIIMELEGGQILFHY